MEYEVEGRAYSDNISETLLFEGRSSESWITYKLNFLDFVLLKRSCSLKRKKKNHNLMLKSRRHKFQPKSHLRVMTSCLRASYGAVMTESQC